MKQDCKSLVGLLTVGMLALAPAYAQSAQGAGKGQGAGHSQTQSGSDRHGQSGAGHEGHDQKGSANRLSADSTFMNKVAQHSAAEIQMGQLAVQKASNDDVKKFGQQMVDDHTKASEELKQLASQKGVTLPTDMDAKHKATHDRLAKLSGAEFDRAYMQEMVTDHREDVNEFRRQSKSGSDSDVKAWAAKTLPTLEHHLQMAEATNAKVKK